MKKGKITGIGGVFFKSANADKMRRWYAENFDLQSDEHGHAFIWKKKDNPQKNGYTAWNAFDDKSDYFAPSDQKYMINYRVENLDELIKELRQNGVKIIGKTEIYDYGKFAWVLDPEGNKIELWEPVDEVFDEYYENK